MGAGKISLSNWFQVSDSKGGYNDFSFWYCGRLHFLVGPPSMQQADRSKYIFQSIVVLTKKSNLHEKERESELLKGRFWAKIGLYPQI